MLRLHDGREGGTRGEPAIFATFVRGAMDPDNSLRPRRRPIAINPFYRSSAQSTQTTNSPDLRRSPARIHWRRSLGNGPLKKRTANKPARSYPGAHRNVNF